MIPFHKLYSWLFKSFNISWETIIIDRLISEWYTEFMIIKRSWIFAVFMLWIPVSILVLAGLSIYIAYSSIEVINIRYTFIGGNILMASILIISTINYIRHFRSIHHEPQITNDIATLKNELTEWDIYFQSFFNWSITNQWFLVWIFCMEIALVLNYWKQIGDNFWILTLDTLVILIEIWLLRQYRKRMMDLEMDYNILVQGKIFFVNQSWLLSVIQTIDWEKIKTVQSIFPSKIASFFNYGTVHILTEWDNAMIGTMSMYYVTNPDKTVAHIQDFIDEDTAAKVDTIVKHSERIPDIKTTNNSKTHTLDTREKIRDVLR